MLYSIKEKRSFHNKIGKDDNMNENLELVEYIYKDAGMASYTLTKLLEEINGKDNKIKGCIEDILKGYERYIKEAEEILTEANVELKQESMMAKMASSMGIKKEVISDNSDASLADMLIKGISMGTLDMEKKIKSYKEDADKKYLKLAKDFYKFQQDNLEALKKFL